MIQHEVRLHINRPLEQVFAYVADVRNWKAWQEHLEQVEPATRGPLRVGTQIREVRHSGGRSVENRAQITALEPNKRFETKTVNDPMVVVSYWFEAEEGGTRVSYRYVMETRGTRRLLQPMLARSIKLQQDSELEKLKSVLEPSSDSG